MSKTTGTSRTRRQVVATLGALGVASFALRERFVAEASAATLPATSCVLSPAMTDGPFFVYTRLRRSDLTADTPRAAVVKGSPLFLNIELAAIHPPGWYLGRAIHIHVKVRQFNAAGNATLEFSTQLYFDDAASDAVMALTPYNARGPRTVRNGRDFIFGNNSVALVKLSAPADGSCGHMGTITLGLRRPA